VREAGYAVYGSEGEESGAWVLVDCGDAVVHIMQPAIRDYYKLEELWLDGTLEFPKPKRQVRETAEAAKPLAGTKPKKVSDKKETRLSKKAWRRKKVMTGVERVAGKESTREIFGCGKGACRQALRKKSGREETCIGRCKSNCGEEGRDQSADG
jgi:ribosome-associated protein